MEKKYKIQYLPIFYKDLDKITNYISNKLSNTIAANNLLDVIEKEIYKRQSSPENYQKYIPKRERKNIYYRIYVKNYKIFYTVKDNTMEIRRILYSKRNFENLI